MECIQRNIQERWADSDRRFRSSEEWSFYCRSIDAYTLDNCHFEPQNGGLEDVWKMLSLSIGWFLGFMFDSQGCKRECMFLSPCTGHNCQKTRGFREFSSTCQWPDLSWTKRPRAFFAVSVNATFPPRHGNDAMVQIGKSSSPFANYHRPLSTRCVNLFRGWNLKFSESHHSQKLGVPNQLPPADVSFCWGREWVFKSHLFRYAWWERWHGFLSDHFS